MRKPLFIALILLSFVDWTSAADDPGANGRAAGTRPARIPAESPAPMLTNSPRFDQGTLAEPDDQVFPDDLIVQGSLCSGFDCVNNEAFGDTTIKLKENNLRIKFEDTSTGEFPSTDWQLTANEPESGGANLFMIEDVTAATSPFVLIGGAPSNSMFVGSNGKVGFRTASPVLDVHVSTTDTPAHRLEQTNAGGFTAQTWDIAGNEANFFIRDVTGGSRLPFRIRPGAATSSLDIGADGEIRLAGALDTSAKVSVQSTAANASPESMLSVVNSSFGSGSGFDNETAEYRFLVDSNGNVSARGTIAQLSARASKENLVPVDHVAVLDRLERLPIVEWNYRDATDDDRHIGPTAEDFHTAFGLGTTDQTIALTDMAGIALAAVQALTQEVASRDQLIARQAEALNALEARVRELEQAR